MENIIQSKMTYLESEPEPDSNFNSLIQCQILTVTLTATLILVQLLRIFLSLFCSLCIYILLNKPVDNFSFLLS